MNREIVYVSFMLAVYLVPARLCKPVFKDREIQIIKEQNPCHTEVSESPGRAGRENITDLHQLAVRIEGLQIVIEEAKDKITKGGEIVKACALVKFSNQAVNFSCTNIVANDEKEMADCLASSYQTINRFSMSVKEAKEEGESNGMLDKVMDLLEEVDRYTDQTLCAILKDLKSLGYNILFHKIPQRKNISIYNEFVEESKTKQFDSCFRVQTKLNRIQVFHVVYQLLDTYTDALQVMKKAFTETALPSTTTSTTPTTKFDIDQIIIG